MVWNLLTVGTNTNDGRARWRLGYEKGTDTYTISCAAYNAFINGDPSLSNQRFMVVPATEYTGSNGFKFKLEKQTSDGYYYIRCVGSNAYITGLVDNCCFYQGKASDKFGTWWDKQWVFKITPLDDGTVTIWHQGSGKYLWSVWSPPSCKWYDVPCWGGELARKLFNNPLEFGKDLFTSLVDSASNLVDTANNIFFAPLLEQAVKAIDTSRITNAMSKSITNAMTNSAILKGSAAPMSDTDKIRARIIVLLILMILLYIIIVMLAVRFG